jgi:2-iminobutanoate/2-iminopropanoate deaminase
MRPIHPEGGPRASGAYVPGIRAGQLVFVSGQGPHDPVTGALPSEDLADQVHATLANVERVLAAAGGSLSDVVRVDAYLADLAAFDVYDAAFREVFGSHLPTRTTVGAALGEIQVEINAIAYLADGTEAG